MRGLQRSEQGLRIKIRHKILVTALMVGFCGNVGAQAAHAPKMGYEMHPKAYAKVLVLGQWGSRKEFVCLDKLWTLESHWNPKALNKSSGAYGIAQFMPSTWAHYHAPYRPKSALLQITFGLRYITVRYTTPCEAVKHERKQGWY